jgi:hypothetical protein
MSTRETRCSWWQGSGAGYVRRKELLQSKVRVSRKTKRESKTLDITH